MNLNDYQQIIYNVPKGVKLYAVAIAARRKTTGQVGTLAVFCSARSIQEAIDLQDLNRFAQFPKDDWEGHTVDACECIVRNG
jgi:hypothetical protein